MEWISLPPVRTPAEWLAWDEGLLDSADAFVGEGSPPEWLWFWEAATPFVVVGDGQNLDSEVHVNDCVDKNIPILRRCTGGGTVVQGPGCLNYALVLEIPTTGPLATIAESNRWIMERNRQALAGLLSEPIVVRGHTDLAIQRHGLEFKFSGNAQRRKRRALLFHGTILLNFDLRRISQCLRQPSWAPDYRNGRNHTGFVVNTGLSGSAVREAMAREWTATAAGMTPDPETIRCLMETRYGRPEWHQRR